MHVWFVRKGKCRRIGMMRFLLTATSRRVDPCHGYFSYSSRRVAHTKCISFFLSICWECVYQFTKVQHSNIHLTDLSPLINNTDCVFKINPHWFISYKKSLSLFSFLLSSVAVHPFFQTVFNSTSISLTSSSLTSFSLTTIFVFSSPFCYLVPCST